MFKNSEKWFQLVENTDKLNEFLKTLRSNGVQEITLGEITLKFNNFLQIAAEDVSRYSNLKEPEKRHEDDEDLLYYSAGS